MHNTKPYFLVIGVSNIEVFSQEMHSDIIYFKFSSEVDPIYFLSLFLVYPVLCIATLCFCKVATCLEVKECPQNGINTVL